MLARFVSADTVVPGMAIGAGGALGTLGMDKNASMKGLTTNYQEVGMVSAVNQENQVTIQKGFYFQLNNSDKKKTKAFDGPLNSQSLNRYSYVLNNPLRYSDPTGHSLYLLQSEVTEFVADIRQLADEAAKEAVIEVIQHIAEKVVFSLLEELIPDVGTLEGIATAITAFIMVNESSAALELTQFANDLEYFSKQNPNGLAIQMDGWGDFEIYGQDTHYMYRPDYILGWDAGNAIIELTDGHIFSYSGYWNLKGATPPSEMAARYWRHLCGDGQGENGYGCL